MEVDVDGKEVSGYPQTAKKATVYPKGLLTSTSYPYSTWNNE